MSHISQTQKDPSDIQGKKSLTAYEYYNKYVRQEGEKVLTEAEFAARQALRNKQIFDKVVDKDLLNEIKQYPLTPDNASTNTGQSD